MWFRSHNIRHCILYKEYVTHKCIVVWSFSALLFFAYLKNRTELEMMWNSGIKSSLDTPSKMTTLSQACRLQSLPCMPQLRFISRHAEYLHSAFHLGNPDISRVSEMRPTGLSHSHLYQWWEKCQAQPSISPGSVRVVFFREPENGWKHQSASCFVIAQLLSAVLYLSVSDGVWWVW